MFVKVLAVFLILGVCLAIPVEDFKHSTTPVPIPTKVPPHHVQGLPPKPPKPDNSDLKTDASTWWHTYYHPYPVYYYNVHHTIPAFTIWPTIY